MNKRTFTAAAVLLTALWLLAACAPKGTVTVPAAGRPLVLGLHVIIDNRPAAETLIGAVPALAARGVNLLIVEVDYGFEYVSHPELRGEDPISKDTVKRLLAACRRFRIRLVPQFQSLGHQSWAEKTYPLLVKYPQFDESPGLYPGNKGKEPSGIDFYCRSWCPLHPDLNPIVFALYDELIDAFEADTFHVGMDEVFIIGNDACPRCRGKNPAELFARAVNDAYGHIVKTRRLEMMMWGDRLIDGQATGYGLWEASKNGTHPAIDLVPKDIIICDWHYERKYHDQGTKSSRFPSIGIFLDKGFRVLPTSFRDVKAVRLFIDQSLAFPSERMLGHLCTIWRGLKPGEASKLRQLKAAAKRLRRAPART